MSSVLDDVGLDCNERSESNDNTDPDANPSVSVVVVESVTFNNLGSVVPFDCLTTDIDFSDNLLLLLLSPFQYVHLSKKDK